MENKDLRNSKCNKGEMKNILVGSSIIIHLKLTFIVFRKMSEIEKNSLKICLEISNVSFK